MSNLILSDEQFRVYNELVEFITTSKERELILIGYAGTGKTTLVTKFITDVINSRLLNKIAIAAPTHKAVGIIKNKLYTEENLSKGKNIHRSLEITTIHRLLNYKNYIDTNGSKYFAKSKVETHWNIYNLIIVDECSMLNNQVIGDIKEELDKDKNSKVKVIYVGDPAQLPPVNQGTSRIFERNLRKLFLEKIIRTNNNDIVNISNSHRKWILSGNDKDMPVLGDYDSKNVNLFPNKEYIEWLNTFINNIKEEELDEKNDISTSDFNSNIILTWTNKKCELYNDYIRKQIFKKKVLNKFEEGELLIFSDYYRIKEEDNTNNSSNSKEKNYINFYTSEQVKLYEINESRYVFEQNFTNIVFNNKNEKIRMKTLSLENSNIINEINKIFLEGLSKLNTIISEPIMIYEMFVKKINNEEEFKNIFLKYKKKLEIGFYKLRKSKIEENMKYIKNISNNLFEMNKLVNQFWLKNKNANQGTDNNDLIKIICIHEKSESKYNQIIKDGTDILIILKELIYKNISKLTIDNLAKCDYITEIDSKINKVWNYWNENIVDTFAQLNYGYCITVHKSQGSTFKNVFIDIFDIFENNNKDETLKCLYTAITRCSESLYLLV